MGFNPFGCKHVWLSNKQYMLLRHSCIKHECDLSFALGTCPTAHYLIISHGQDGWLFYILYNRDNFCNFWLLFNGPEKMFRYHSAFWTGVYT